MVGSDVLLVSIGFAGESPGSAWPAESLPVELWWWGAPSGISEEEVAGAVEGARAAWTEEVCSAFDLTLVNEESIPDPGNGTTELSFEDPLDDFEEGILFVVLPRQEGGRSTTWNGVRYDALSESDIVFNDGIPWATDSAIERGGCEDAWSLQATLTRALGMLAGLPHFLCGDECTPEQAAATMASSDVCDTSGSTIEALDVLALTSIYGTPTLLECGPAVEDTMAVECHVVEPEGAVATWEFGDGDGADGDLVSHTYAAEGQYEVRGCVDFDGCDHPTCVTFDVAARSGGTVTPATTDGEKTASGCAAAPGGGGSAWVLGVLALVWRRSRRG